MDQKSFAALPEGTELVITWDVLLNKQTFENVQKGTRCKISYGGKYAGSSPKRRQCTISGHGRFWLSHKVVELPGDNK